MSWLRSCLILLCQLCRNAFGHGHELLREPLLGRLKAKPIGDLAMHLRQRRPTAIRTWGKRAPWSARASSLLSLSPLLPHQETVRQHHGHRRAVEARPQSALILVPAQQPLGLLMILLHPMPPMGVFHQPLQRHIRPEVAPREPPLAIGGILADQPARFSLPRRGHPPDPQGDELPAHPALAPLPPRHRAPRPRRLGPDQLLGPLG